MNEQKLKKQVLYFMLFAKLIIVAYIWMNKTTGGFTTDQALSAITLITPLFAVYLGVMYKELVKHRLETKETKTLKPIAKSFRNLAYITLFIYFVIIFVVVTLKATGTFSFKQFQAMLGTVESGFSVYVGQIIFSLFKKEEQNNEKE